MKQLLLTLAGITIDKSNLTIPQNTPDGSLASILKIVFTLAGATSIVVITVAGLQMVLSSGNPDAVNKSRNAVIYALIGLVICISGFSIVTFVINKL